MTFLLYSFLWVCTYFVILAANVVAGVLEKKQGETNWIFKKLYNVDEYERYEGKWVKDITVFGGFLNQLFIPHCTCLIFSTIMASKSLLIGVQTYFIVFSLHIIIFLLFILTKYLYKILVELLGKVI